MRTTNKILLLSLLAGLLTTGCNDKYICHDCQSGSTSVDVDYDWSITESQEDRDCDLVIIGEDGDSTTVSTSSNGSPLDLGPGIYVLYVHEQADNVQTDRHIIRVDTKENGNLHVPTPFSSGEGTITVVDGVANVSTVQMIRQTRELIVKIRVKASAAHLMPYESFEGELSGVTLSRDLFYGFPPQECSHREVAPSEYGILEKIYERDAESESEAYPMVFSSCDRLIGIGGSDIENLLSLKVNTETSEITFFTFDATKALETFHTLEEVSVPFLLVIDLDLLEDGVTGEIRGVIIDWIFGKETDLIANEK